MKSLFESNRFALTEVIRSGKKEIAGTLRFESLESDRGDFRRILAVRGGVVTFAGRAEPGTKAARYGVHVKVLCDDADPFEMIYSGLDCRFPAKGQRIMPGDKVGFQAFGKVTLECRRNGRLIDAPAQLGITPKPQEWSLK